MSEIDDCVAAGAGYADSFPGGLAGPPARHVAVLTCMDARILPEKILGLHEGDVHVIRNAGGVVSDDVVRSLAMSQRLLGTRAVMIIQHTSCGMSGLDDAGFRDQIEAEVGQRPSWAEAPFGDDLAANVTRTVRELRENVNLPNTDDIRGFVFDVGSGQLTEVTAP